MSKKNKTNGATLADHQDFSTKMHTTPEKHASMIDARDVMGLTDNAHAAKMQQGGAPMIEKFGGDSCFGGKGCS